MNITDNTPRKDPLIDAYHQASVREGARASAHLRAAVLAHARVVAQSVPSSTTNAAILSDTTRATAAANEPRPLWRLAAGVVIGLVGVWIFQLTRPASPPESTVATASIPQADNARVAASVAATAPAAAPPETTVAVAAPAPATPSDAVDTSVSRARVDGGSSRKPAPSTRADANVAMATAAPPAERFHVRAPAPAVVNAGATQSAVTAADASGNEIFSETVVASAELRKSAKVAASPFNDRPALAAAAPRMSSAAPNAFPAQTAEPLIAAAPTPASPPPVSVAPERPQSRPLDERDQAMFTALRAGNLPALRAAIARGANVNARDERGRTTLQIARDRDDAAVVDVLQAAGAR